MAAVRRPSQEDGWSNRELARKFGVAHTTIARLLADGK
ncbi:MAG: helix-turn-helix domain-containing protein [Bifidobacteriaceae bacterium]|nr:helix-turn-helix domain-containing protein [Bifidobacteriaceae bacterium]